MGKKSSRTSRKKDPPSEGAAHDDAAANEALHAFLHQDPASFSWAFYPMAISTLFQTGHSDVRILRNYEVWRELGRCFGGENGLAFVRGIYDEVPPLYLHIHYGLTIEKEPFWMVQRQDGEAIGLVFPQDAMAMCFNHLMHFIQALYAQVNSSPYSPSCCYVTPDQDEIVAKIRTMCPDISADES